MSLVQGGLQNETGVVAQNVPEVGSYHLQVSSSANNYAMRPMLMASMFQIKIFQNIIDEGGREVFIIHYAITSRSKIAPCTRTLPLRARVQLKHLRIQTSDL